MKIDTTVNITDKNRSLLTKHAKKLQISRNELAITLIATFLKKQSGKYRTFTQIT